MSGLLAGVLVALALLLWPRRSGDEVSVHLAGLARRRAASDRRDATVASLRGALTAEPGGVTQAAGSQWTAAVRSLTGRSPVREESVLGVLDGLSAALGAGLPPAAALRVVAGATPGTQWVHPVLAAAEDGQQLGPAWRAVAEEHDSTALRQVASSWSLSERSGAALAPAVAGTAETVRRHRESRQSASAAASGAMASMYMLSALPLVGLAGAAALGYSPRQLYLEQPLGLVSAGLGVLMLAVGWVVSRRLVRMALRGRAVR